jgi:hypothetical protein
MRVIVKFHETARTDYEEWQARLSESPTGSEELARVHVEELIRRFEETGGLPAEATFHPDLDPPSWVWRFSSDTWVRFTRRVTRSGMFGRPTAEVIVIGVSVHPPD